MFFTEFNGGKPAVSRLFQIVYRIAKKSPRNKPVRNYGFCVYTLFYKEPFYKKLDLHRPKTYLKSTHSIKKCLFVFHAFLVILVDFPLNLTEIRNY